MYTIVIVLTVIVAVLLIGIVLIQKSKGGGLSSQFGGAGAVMGVRQTNNFLEKATWTLIACLFVLSILSAFTMPRNNGGTQLRTQPVEAPDTVEFPAGQFDTPVNIPAEAAAEATGAAETAAETAAE